MIYGIVATALYYGWLLFGTQIVPDRTDIRIWLNYGNAGDMPLFFALLAAPIIIWSIALLVRQGKRTYP